MLEDHNIQPKQDSNGRKVPEFEAKDISNADRNWSPPQSRPSWKTWARRSSEWGKSFASNLSNLSTSTKPFHLGRKDLWKPASLKIPVLGSLFLVSLGLIGLLEFLAHLASRNNNENDGGLTFAESEEELSNGVEFLYFYLPTIIAVLYGMVWAWIDLDVKRLEPWYQLARPEGATAENSMLLKYQFNFAGFVPHRALKRRHWAVFSSGTAMIFLGWVLLPLQAAIFSTGTTHRTRTVPMARTHRWMTLEEQSSQLDSKFLTTAYGMSWLDQKLPKWTTPDYALLPFQPLDDNTEFRSTETWSAPTTMYYTNVTCKPAINVTQLTMINWLFDDGEGCIAPELRLIFPETTETKDLMVLYIPYWKDELYFLADNMDRQLLGPNCTREANRHKFLSITAQYKPDTATFNSTQGYYDVVSAQFCQPTYHSRPVVATVNATNEAVVGVEYDATLAPNVIPEEALNITRYELLIGTGTHNTSFNREDEDLAHVHERTQIQQYEKIAKYDIGWPTSYMVPFTIAQSLSMNISADELHEPRKMVEALDRTHKLLFISAMNQLMLPIRSTDDVGVVGGTRRDRPTGVLFIREFSIVVEVSLALIAVMIVALWVHYEYRGNKLIKDPGSMLDIMRMIQTSQVLLREFDDNGTVSEDILAERIKGRRYRLTTVTRGNGPEMQLEALDAEVHQVSDGHSQKSTQIDCPEQFMAARPSELSYWTAASSFLLISAAIAVLAAFYARAVRNNGIEKPTDNAFVMTVLTNLIPTAFATYIEPFWVVLNRLLCLLKPFDELRAGDAQPEGTIEARYASVPPQLTLFDALKAKHYLLAFICAVALSTNILAVALSGLFNENAVWVAIPTTTTPRFADAFSDELYIIAGSSRGSAGNTGFQHLDSYYAMLANYSGNAPLPPWVDTKYYYMPFDIPAGPDGSNGTEVGIDIAAYEAQTRGYGIELDCKVPSTQRGAEDNIEFSALAPEPGRPSATLFFTLSHTLDNGTEIKCGPEHGTNESTKMFPRQFPGNGTARLEGLGPLAPQPGPAGMYDNYCFLQFVYGLGRLGPVPDNTTTPEADLKNATDGRSVDGSFIQCQPSFKTAMFDVRVDAQGRIQSSNRTTEFADNFDFLEGRPLFDDDPVTAILMQINEMTANPQPLVFQFEWNAHSFVRHWMSSAIITRRNSSEWYDVDKPLPPPEAMIKDVKAVYELNAAIILSFAETLFKPPIEGSTMAVDLIVKQERIFLEPAMLYICIVLLVIQLLALLAFYTHRPGQFLPRMPLSVASLIGFVAASHAVQEAGSEKSKDTRYGYGRFRGVDGRSHVGIDKMPVIPLESVNPESKKRGRLSVLIGREKAPGSPRFWI